MLIGRGAFLKRRSCTGRSSGFLRRENAGMSSERKVRILPGKSGPKARSKDVVDG